MWKPLQKNFVGWKSIRWDLNGGNLDREIWGRAQASSPLCMYNMRISRKLGATDERLSLAERMWRWSEPGLCFCRRIGQCFKIIFSKSLDFVSQPCGKEKRTKVGAKIETQIWFERLWADKKKRASMGRQCAGSVQSAQRRALTNVELDDWMWRVRLVVHPCWIFFACNIQSWVCLFLSPPSFSPLWSGRENTKICL